MDSLGALLTRYLNVRKKLRGNREKGMALPVSHIAAKRLVQHTWQQLWDIYGSNTEDKGDKPLLDATAFNVIS